MSDITIRIKNKEWRNWAQVSVVRSVDNIAGAFMIKLPSDAFKDGVKANFNFGDSVVITVNDYKLITGYLEQIEYEYGPEENTFLLSGRDVTGALVDCSFVGDASEWKSQSVSSLIAKLCSPFGIGVAIDNSATANAAQILDTFKATEGERVFEIISRLCSDHALSAISLGDGRLTLTQMTTTRKLPVGIVMPGNCQAARFTGSNNDRYSSYLVKGVGIGNANKRLEDFIQPFGEGADDVLTVTKPTVIFSNTPADAGSCQTRADWECRYNAGISRQFVYDMTSWAQSEKVTAPWDIHNLVQVQDTKMNLNTQLYIREIEYSRSGDDEDCRLSCVFPFTYSPSAIILKTEFDT
jgi:prophage tail gpP-like protein